MAIEKHTWDKVNQWQEEIEFLKSIIAKTELVETIKWGTPVYMYQNKNIIGLGGFKSYFGVWFMNGVYLKDEAKKLVNAQEGVTKALRQWRFQSKEEINKELLLEYIHEAIQNEIKGISHKPEKKKVELCDLFKDELKQDPDFAKAFEQFSAYKQK
jgi:uncharacterized protein YdeI (YjbR/CyaY-like superfamily)